MRNAIERKVPSWFQGGLSFYTDSASKLLGSNLVGIYLYGSVATGCANQTTSDIDVVVILNSPIDQDTKRELRLLQQEIETPIDAMYVTRDDANRDVWPTPIQGIVRAGGGCRESGDSVDFPLVRSDLYHNGVTIFGDDVRSAVEPVPEELLRSALWEMFPLVRERFKNPVLMLCRIVCSLKTGKPCSKLQAGEWALSHFDEQWRPVIEKALQEYRDGATKYNLANELGREFEAYCRHVAKDDLSSD